MQAAISSRQRRSSRLGVENAKIRDRHFAFSLANPQKSTKPPVGLTDRVQAVALKNTTRVKFWLRDIWERLLVSLGYGKKA